MPVPASINDLSTTAGSNSPPGSESPATLDDYLRTHAAFIAQLRDRGRSRNIVINGEFQVKQADPATASGTVTLTAGQYGWAAASTKGFDRWKAGASGCTYSFATSGGVTTLTITAGSLQQVIEGINLQTGTHVLSWTGTAQGKIGAGGYSASGVTGSVTGGSNLTIEFNTGTLSFVQLELGSGPTPFEYRQVGAEISLCQRYYEIARWGVQWFAGAGGTSHSLAAPITYRQPKRATPTIAAIATIINANASALNFNAVSTYGGYGIVEPSTAGATNLTVDLAISSEI